MMLCVNVTRTHEDQQFLIGCLALDELVLSEVEQRLGDRGQNLFCREVRFLLVLNFLNRVDLSILYQIGVRISALAYESLRCPDFILVLKLCQDLVGFFKAHFVSHENNSSFVLCIPGFPPETHEFAPLYDFRLPHNFALLRTGRNLFRNIG